MNIEKYKKKLSEFNSTEKYANERSMLLSLLELKAGDKVLDYGTGLGRNVRYVNRYYENVRCFGYDYYNLVEEPDESLFRSSYHFKFNKVFFMHSLAHIPDVEGKLMNLKETFLQQNAIVSVITPNKEWLSLLNQAREFISDDTVISHFTIFELERLFISTGYKVLEIGQIGEQKGNQKERLFIKATIR